MTSSSVAARSITLPLLFLELAGTGAQGLFMGSPTRVTGQLFREIQIVSPTTLSSASETTIGRKRSDTSSWIIWLQRAGTFSIFLETLQLYTQFFQSASSTSSTHEEKKIGL